MARTCTICRHTQRNEIDRALVAGEPYRSVAQRFEASAPAVYRHQRGHLVKAMVKAHDAREVAHGDSLVAQLQDLQQRALGILTEAERSGDHRTALAAIRESRGCLELGSKLTGKLVEQHEHVTNHNITVQVLASLAEEIRNMPVVDIQVPREELLQGEEALPGFGGFEPPLDVGDPNPLLLSRR